MKKTVLAGLRLDEIEKITDDLKASKFRAKQIHNWIYIKSVSDISQMTDLSLNWFWSSFLVKKPPTQESVR